MAKSNKERQKAYRDRKRAKRNATVTPPIADAEEVTPRSQGKSYIGIDGFERQFICRLRGEDIYAVVVPAHRLADPPDPEDDWSPVVYGSKKDGG